VVVAEVVPLEVVLPVVAPPVVPAVPLVPAVPALVLSLRGPLVGSAEHANNRVQPRVNA
jgi:hypothetical protein